jgi:hypothetical protein
MKNQTLDGKMDNNDFSRIRTLKKFNKNRKNANSPNNIYDKQIDKKIRKLLG